VAIFFRQVYLTVRFEQIGFLEKREERTMGV
jgi:hypothetical protein